MKELSIFLFVLLNCLPLTHCEVKNASACYGVSGCNLFELQCDAGSRIRLLSQKYGYKDYRCNADKRRKRCLSPAHDGCCVYEPDDCIEPYTTYHTYNLMRECSGKNQCGPQQAPYNILTSCGDNESTYIHLQYDCFTTDTVKNICEDQMATGTEMSIVFDQAATTLSEPTSCICDIIVLNGDEMEVEYIDVRMMRSHNETERGSLCSSAILRGEEDRDKQLKCNESISEEENLIDNIIGIVNMTNGRQLKIILENLFAGGADDSPLMVWLKLRVVSGTLRTKCYREAPQPPTLPTQTTTTVVTYPVTTAIPPVTGSHNNTGESTKRDDDSTAVIVGVLIPVLVLVAVGVVLFILWRRKQHPLKRRHAVQNSYTASVGSRNSSAVNNAEYDEIGDVHDSPQPPLYDPVYEAAREPTHGYVNTRQNGTASENQPENTRKKHHTYQNIKGNKQSTNDQNSKSVQKSTKLPFGDFKNKKAQLLSFFKGKQNNLAPATVQKKPSDASVSSYDHLNICNPEIQLPATPPPEETAHPYAHTKANITITEPQKPPTAQTSPALQKPPDEKKKSPSPRGVKAVEVGDSYIEFQFGTLDEDDPNLFKSKAKKGDVHDTNAKLMKPNRPPPKPSSPKLGESNIPEGELIAPSPTERPEEEITDQQTYDYADAGEDVKTTDSVKVNHSVNAESKDGAIVYSYADVENDETQVMDSLSPDLVYEDVDENPATNIRKCNSAQDLSCDSSGVYEVPVKSHSTRPISAPYNVQSKAKSKPKSAITGLGNVVNEVTSPVGLGNVVKELKEIQDLPDLSDPKSLPNELKYANLGLHTPKSKQKVEKKQTEAIKQSATTKQDKSKPNQNQVIRLEAKSKEETNVVEPAIRKGVLSLAKKFETPNKV